MADDGASRKIVLRPVADMYSGPTELQAGTTYRVTIGLDDQGTPVRSGVYFYKLTAGAFEQSRSLTIVR